MRGHIAKKGQRYYAVVYEGINPATGRPRHRWHAGGSTRRGAERLLAELLTRLHDGTYRPPDRVTLGDYLVERWLPAKSSRLKPATVANYQNIIRLYIVPHIGRIGLQQLRPEDLDGLYARLLAEGRSIGAGEGLSVATVRQVHTVLSSALSDAARKGTVTRNVARTADAPSAAGRGRAMTVWTAAELRTFLGAVAEHPMYSLYYVAAMTGMRRGEVVGLRWRDVDLDAGRLTVHRQIVAVGGDLIEGPPKTALGERTIDLDTRTVAELRRHRRRQLEGNIATGRRDDGNGYVFGNPDGGPQDPKRVTVSFARAVARLDLPRIRFHDLRHTHATLMLQNGAPAKVVSERLGHANIAITLGVYQAVMPGMQADAAEQFMAGIFEQ